MITILCALQSETYKYVLNYFILKPVFTDETGHKCWYRKKNFIDVSPT